MGFKQNDNMDHDAYIAETKAILAAHADLVGSSLIVFEDWEEASAKTAAYCQAADIGLSLNRDTAENWQSYRLRVLEYIKAGIPVLCTTGNDLADHDAHEAAYIARSGDVASYEAALRLAATDHSLRRQKAEAMKKIAKNFSSRETYGRMIDRLDTSPPRDFTNPQEVLFPVALDFPVPEVSPWTLAPNAQIAPTAKAIWQNAQAWRDGDYPLQGSFPAWPSDQKNYAVAFTLTLESKLFSPWAEVVQIGNSPETAQLMISAVMISPQSYRLVFSVFDKNRKETMLVSPDIVLGQRAECRLGIRPAEGRVALEIDGKNYTLQCPPWESQAETRLWIGSRAFAGTVEGVSLYLMPIQLRPS
jgi:hypothetical protein